MARPLESLAKGIPMHFYIAISNQSIFILTIVLEELYLLKSVMAFLKSSWPYFSGRKPDVGKASQLSQRNAGASCFSHMAKKVRWTKTKKIRNVQNFARFITIFSQNIRNC